jgi:benzoyl-CoA reductase/2-hydroxyglutaryl-CoA dehydratase subunit BcrC/BadD/HgdB
MAGPPPIEEQGRLDERTIGITTTVPSEVLFAAGLRPLDLNNAFITAEDPLALVEEAERRGFPRNLCAWVKGIYAVLHQRKVRTVIGVVEGDCSNTQALMEVLESEGIRVVDFAFPYYRRDRAQLAAQIESLAEAVGTTVEAAEQQKARLDAVRHTVHQIDRLTWETGQVTGAENFEWTINCSDFRGEPERYGAEAGAFLELARQRPERQVPLRLGLLGIPPICSDLFARLAELGAEVVFNEVPRQFAMPEPGSTLVEQYTAYTYPYDIFTRLTDMEGACQRRAVDGVVHYVQSFCFRQVQDRLVREWLDLPVLTLECDRPGPLDAGARTRLEAFLEILGG